MHMQCVHNLQIVNQEGNERFSHPITRTANRVTQRAGFESGGKFSIVQAQALTKAVCGDLEKHAYSVNDRIADPALRNAHVLTAVS